MSEERKLLGRTGKNSKLRRILSIAIQNANTAEFLLKKRDELAAKLSTCEMILLDAQTERDMSDAYRKELGAKLEAARKALEIIADSKLSCLGTICRIEAGKALKQIGE